MANKLKLVKQGYTHAVAQQPLRAKQLLVSPLPDGSSALLMVSEDGRVFILGTEGWLAYNMMEVLDDSTV